MRYDEAFEGESKEFIGYVHPGDILVGEYLEETELTQSQLAKDLGVTFQTINRICNRRQSITPDMAVKLAYYFGNSPREWMEYQLKYDLEKVLQERSTKLRKEVSKLAPWREGQQAAA